MNTSLCRIVFFSWSFFLLFFLVGFSKENGIKIDEIPWGDWDHYAKYDMSIIRADETILGARAFTWRELNDGIILLYCEESGCLLRLFPSKGMFEVLIFPDPNSKRGKFQITSIKKLKDNGIPVNAIDELLHPIRPGMEGRPRKLELHTRIVAHVRSET